MTHVAELAPVEWDLCLVDDWNLEAILGKAKGGTPPEVMVLSTGGNMEETEGDDAAPKKETEIAAGATKDAILDEKK
ncbi:hypothetical protein ACOSP7_002722 [Xanthoceras sorbifolium]